MFIDLQVLTRSRVIIILESIIDLFSCFSAFWGMDTTQKSYPSDISDTEWDFLLPYQTLMRMVAPRYRQQLHRIGMRSPLIGPSFSLFS